MSWKNRLKTCVWELTLQCNMNCIHCGSSAGSPRANELTLEECLRVADDLIKLECRLVSLIGGEVFLFKGWDKIAAKLSENGVLVNIITNGYFLEETQINQIKNANLVNVAVSIDGMEENHDRIRNRKGSFRNALITLDKLHSHNISTAAITSLLDFNFYDLEPLHQVLSGKNVKVWQLQMANPMGNLSGIKDILLKEDKIPEITDFIRQKRGKMAVYAADDIGYFDENEPYIRGIPGVFCSWNGCQAGISAIGIGSDGSIKGCESLYADEFIEGNVRNEPLIRIWEDESRFAYNRTFQVSNLEGRCKDCEKGERCRGGCRGICYFINGRLYDNPYCRYNLNKS